MKLSVGSPVNLSNAVDGNHIERTRTIWQPRVGGDLTDEDARQIAANVTGFFTLLAQWSQAEMHSSASDVESTS